MHWRLHGQTGMPSGKYGRISENRTYTMEGVDWKVKTNMPEHVTQEFLNTIKMPNPGANPLNYLFVMPRIATSNDSAYMFPYGFAMVLSALKASGRSVFTLNLNYKSDSYVLLKDVIIENSIDVVLTGGLSGQYSTIKEIADTTKATNSNIVVCVGGGIITADPVVAMEALETADYGVIGEGEITVNAFAYALENNEEMKHVEGLVLRDGTITKPRPEITNLDMLPFPDYDGLEFELLMQDDPNVLPNMSVLGSKLVPLATSRSCPYNCTFCFHSSGRKYRRRSIDNIFMELDWVISKYPISNVYAIDELFTHNEDFVEAFAKRIKKRGLPFFISSHVNFVTKRMIQTLKEGGCYRIFFGVESADNNILKSMKKHYTIEQIDKAFAWAYEIGIASAGFLIFGDVKESPDTIATSLNWYKNFNKKWNDPDYPIRLLYILTYPGTHLYKVACERGIIADPVRYLKDGEYQINLTTMSDELYWEMVKRIELFNVLFTQGVDVDFHDIPNIISILRENLNNLINEGCKVALWPATYVTIRIIEYISPEFISCDNVFFVNKNPDSLINNNGLIGHTGSLSVDKIMGIRSRTYLPDDILTSGEIDTVICATNFMFSGKIFYQISEEIKERYSCVKRLIKLSDLIV